MNSLMLLLFGLLCFGSGILGQQTKTTRNQLPGVHHISSDPDKTLTRILPHAVELAHDKNLAVQCIVSLPTKKCKNSTKQKQYQQLRTYLRRNLKQLGRGIIVLSNLTKAQSQDVADLAAIINSREDDDCEEAINTKGISHLIHAVMMAVQNHTSDQPSSTSPKDFKNKKIVFPFDNRLQSHMEKGLPQGYKRMASSPGGVPGATPRSEKAGKPITAFGKKSATYFEFPSTSDDEWTLSDSVEKNKTNPMLLIIGLKPKTNKKIYKYYDLPLTEEKAKENADGNFGSLDKRWKMPLQRNVTYRCEISTPERSKVKVARDQLRSRIKNTLFRRHKQSSAEFDGESLSDESSDLSEADTKSNEPKRNGKLQPKYGKVTDRLSSMDTSKELDSKETSAESQELDESDKIEANTRKRQPKYEKIPLRKGLKNGAKEPNEASEEHESKETETDPMSGESKRNRKHRPEYEKRPFKRVDSRKNTKDIENDNISKMMAEDDLDFDNGKHLPTYDAMLKDFPITDGTDGKAEADTTNDFEAFKTSTQDTDDNESDDILSKFPIYDLMRRNFPRTYGTSKKADTTNDPEDFKTPDSDDNEYHIRPFRLPPYNKMLKDFPITYGSDENADSTYNSEDFKTPSHDAEDLIVIEDKFPEMSTYNAMPKDFPMSYETDENADSTYNPEDFKTFTHDDLIVIEDKFPKMSTYDAMHKDFPMSYETDENADYTYDSEDFNTLTQDSDDNEYDVRASELPTYNEILENFPMTDFRTSTHDDLIVIEDKFPKMSTYNAMPQDFPMTYETHENAGFKYNPEDAKIYTHDDLIVIEDKFPKVSTYDATLQDFPIPDGMNVNTYDSEDSPTHDDLIAIRYRLPKMSTYKAMSKDFPMTYGTDKNADSTYNFEDFKIPTHDADDNKSDNRPSKVPIQADNVSSNPKKNKKRPFSRVDFIKGPNSLEQDFTSGQNFDVKISETKRKKDRSVNDQQNNKLGKEQYNKPSKIPKYDAIPKELPISDGKRRVDPTNSSKKLKTPTQNGTLKKTDGRTFNDTLEEYVVKKISSRLQDSDEDSEKAKTYTESNEPKENRKRRPKFRKRPQKSVDFIKDRNSYEENSKIDQSSGEKKTETSPKKDRGFNDQQKTDLDEHQFERSSKESTYDAMLKDFSISDGNKRPVSSYSSGVPAYDAMLNNFPISDGNRRADSIYSSPEFKTPHYNEALQDPDDNHQPYEKKPNDRQNYERAKYQYSNQLVDEDNLDYDYGENNGPSKVPRYDENGYDPTSDFDYSKFDAMNSEENDDYNPGAFDMDMEIDPWIF